MRPTDINMDETMKLRDRTEISQMISFRTNYYNGDLIDTITGTVIKKYPMIFMLNDGRTFKWTDYLIGYIY